MERRSFLRTVASTVPALALHNLAASHALAELSASATSDALHVVGDGEDRFGHPHSMGFSSLLFKVVGGETAGGLFVLEHRHLLPGGPALHLHTSQEEWFYVMDGKVAFQVGDQRLELGPGESVLAPRRIPHTFSSVAEGPSHMMIAFCPAGKMEQYFRDAADPKTPEAEAEYLRRYDMELIGPSPFWKS
jgi:mannose-6-phosphate isomerase-like protein (cupin superfamily)